jgi:superfamily II RNA helicase
MRGLWCRLFSLLYLNQYQINSANELILTELILENTLATYEPEEVVALLSCFVFQEKTDGEPVLSPKLETGREAILKIADRVGGIQDYHNVADSRSGLKFGLVEVVYEWSKGLASFHRWRSQNITNIIRSPLNKLPI